MAKIQPNSTIFLIRKLPLSPSSNDTYWWSTPTDQTDFFLRQDGIWLEKNTFVRVNRNKLKIQAKYADCYSCNYMMFKNTSHGNKWFYAFVTKVNYINEETCEIEYKLDVIQTWFFNWLMGKCLIERNHTATDIFGSNLVAEPIEQDSYVKNTNEDLSGYDNLIYRLLNTTSIVLAMGEERVPNGQGGFIWVATDGEFEHGLYSGVSFRDYPIVSLTSDNRPVINNNSIGQLNDFFLQIVNDNKKDSILNVFMFPTAFLQGNPISGYGRFPYSEGYIIPKNKVIGQPLDGYTPKNNKLYTFPYNCICVSSGYGNTELFNIEFFDGNNMDFKINAELVNIPSLEMRATNYKVNNTYDKVVQLQPFPTCPFTIDMYKEYLGNGFQKTVANFVKTEINSVASMASGAMIGSIPMTVGGALGAANGLLNAAVDIQYASTLGGKVFNAQPTPSMRVANLDNSFHIYNYCYNYYKLKQIDEFFTMYGYQINQIDEPKIHNRSYYTYIKTVDCNCYGDLPAEDAREVEKIFNSGVRFWAYPDVIYNYSVNNQPINDMNIVS